MIETAGCARFEFSPSVQVANVPVISLCCRPWVHNVANSPPQFIDSETISWVSPCPGAKNPFHPHEFPNISPWSARGSTPGASRWHVHYIKSRHIILPLHVWHCNIAVVTSPGHLINHTLPLHSNLKVIFPSLCCATGPPLHFLQSSRHAPPSCLLFSTLL